ncbi:MAG: trigger factor [Planctomycetes bacterium]|nr:trigger factor [Planctomycetota bacterium]
MTDEGLAMQQDEVLDDDATSTDSEGGESSAAVHEEAELSKEEKTKAKLKEAVITRKEDLGSLRMKLTITVPPETIHEIMSDEFAELKRDALIPGFRKGHAPMRLVEKRFATDVGEQLKSQLVANGYFAAVDKENLKPLGDPLFRVTVPQEAKEGQPSAPGTVEKLLPITEALEHVTLPKSGPLTFACEVELRPELELPELKGIPVRKPTIQVTDADVDAEMRRLRMHRATFQPVEEGGVELDDMLYSDMTICVEGREIVKETDFEIRAGNGYVRGLYLEGLGAALRGRRLGDVVTVQAKGPDDHENLELRGKAAEVAFTIREIKRLVVPPWDDEQLERFGCTTEAELRELVRGAQERGLESRAREAAHEQIAQYLLEHTQFEIPGGLSQRQAEQTISRRKMQMYRQGYPEAEIEKWADESRGRALEQAVRDLKVFFILEKIAEDRKIRVSEEVINSAIASMAKRAGKRFDRMRDELMSDNRLSALYLEVRDEAVFDALLAEAAVEAAEPGAANSVVEST